MTTGSQRYGGGDSSRPWRDLAADYEQARAREDSLDRLVEWPAQRELLGDVRGLSVLDAGCGNGGKLAELVRAGAVASVGVDISGNFITVRPPGLELVQGDLSDLMSVPGLAERRFDRIMFLQSFGYAKDPVRALQAARAMLSDDGFILLTRTQPIRYAIERAEQNGTSLGEEYFSTESFSYRHRGWNDDVVLTKRPYTMSDLINVFSAAGLWIEAATEPQLSEDARHRYPHKQAWMNKYLGILIFKLRPLRQCNLTPGDRSDPAAAWGDDHGGSVTSARSSRARCTRDLGAKKCHLPSVAGLGSGQARWGGCQWPVLSAVMQYLGVLDRWYRVLHDPHRDPFVCAEMLTMDDDRNTVKP